LTNARIEYIEIGYLTSVFINVNGSQFQNVETASRFIPDDRKSSKYLIMADVAQFDTDTLCRRSENTIDGIRVVFYKRQIEQAMIFCKKIVDMGYDLFLQPMVTVDYSIQEFEALIYRFCENYQPYAVSIVDSFGCIGKDELAVFIDVLNKCLFKDAEIGFHGHDNLQFSLINAMSLFEYRGNRNFIIDASVNGMGRGAGNLRTELIANYMNCFHKRNYDMNSVLSVISEVTYPISKTTQWGYSPYFMLTVLKRAHPNFATYLLANHDVTVTDFKTFLNLIPDNMLTRSLSDLATNS